MSKLGSSAPLGRDIVLYLHVNVMIINSECVSYVTLERFISVYRNVVVQDIAYTERNIMLEVWDLTLSYYPMVLLGLLSFFSCVCCSFIRASKILPAVTLLF